MKLSLLNTERAQDLSPTSARCNHLGIERGITEEHLLGSQQDVSMGKTGNSICQKDVLLWSFMYLPVLFINLHLMITCTYKKKDKFGASVHHNLQEL